MHKTLECIDQEMSCAHIHFAEIAALYPLLFQFEFVYVLGGSLIVKEVHVGLLHVAQEDDEEWWEAEVVEGNMGNDLEGVNHVEHNPKEGSAMNIKGK